MKKIYTSNNLVDVEMRKEWLDQDPIPCMIKNHRSAMLGGEVPFVEVFPELWVLDDEDFEKAKSILEDWERIKPTDGIAWTCVGCGEVHQPTFTACWKCGTNRR